MVKRIPSLMETLLAHPHLPPQLVIAIHQAVSQQAGPAIPSLPEPISLPQPKPQAKAPSRAPVKSESKPRPQTESKSQARSQPKAQPKPQPKEQPKKPAESKRVAMSVPTPGNAATKTMNSRYSTGKIPSSEPGRNSSKETDSGRPHGHDSRTLLR